MNVRNGLRAKNLSGSQVSLNEVERYLSELKQYELMTPEDELETAVKVLKGCKEARNKMIVCNLRLVVTVARRFRNKTNHRLTLLDLIAEGNTGLIKAVDKFSPHQGHRFSTYAVWWIRDSISTAVMNCSSQVRIPANVLKEISKLNVTAFRNGFAGHTYMNVNKFAELCEVTEEHVTKLMPYQQLSIQTHETTADGLSLSIDPDDIDGSPHPLPHQAKLAQAIHRKLNDILRSMPERSRLIITKRFGLNGSEAMSLIDVGEDLGLSSERVRQVQKEALQKIRQRLETFESSDYFNGRLTVLTEIEKEA